MLTSVLEEHTTSNLREEVKHIEEAWPTKRIYMYEIPTTVT
jgi:hypothetical protein